MVSNRGFSFSGFANKLGTVAVGLALAVAATAASGQPVRGRVAQLLSLGDSVVYGFVTQDGPAYLNPANFLAYPDMVGMRLGVDAVNPACPGETTSSFITGTVPDNGCQGFRAHFPLHVAYTGGQLQYAINYLMTNHMETLVTVSLGANDGFLLQTTCNNNPVCIQAGVPALVATVTTNMNTILGALRATGFRGVLLVVNYYSLDYSDPLQTALTTYLNQALAASAAANQAVVADAFNAFHAAAGSLPAPFTGKTCLTGLLNGNPSDPTQSSCDVHPSLSGQQLLANVVWSTYMDHRRH